MKNKKKIDLEFTESTNFISENLKNWSGLLWVRLYVAIRPTSSSCPKHLDSVITKHDGCVRGKESFGTSGSFEARNLPAFLPACLPVYHVYLTKEIGTTRVLCDQRYYYILCGLYGKTYCSCMAVNVFNLKKLLLPSLKQSFSNHSGT
ncbi:hypothetical protein M0804_004153 [Polistes exclamans]|nr:hypothetical protein M0804_004153 [Polistes exclamans]